MKEKLLILFSLIINYAFSQTGSYQKAWNALNENNWTEASKFLTDAKQDPTMFRDAYITNLYVEAYKGKESEVKDFLSSFYTKIDNPYPFTYALWFNQAVLGSPGKKQFEHQLKLLKQLITDQKAPGTLAASANYQLALHYLFSNDLDKTRSYYDAIGSIKNWQYTGPFENLSQSGFYKIYGPIEHPEPDAVFKSLTNADVKWFVPSVEDKEGWLPVDNQFNNQTAVVYAQNFMNSPMDQTVYCNVGFSGSIKVWINDELVIEESKERITEMDTYITKCDLKKGANRILVQLGFTKNSFPNFIIRFTDEKNHNVPNLRGSSVFAAYPKITNSSKRSASIPLFAEEYFIDQISKSPENLVNYLLLADVYLRNKKVIEARNIMTEAIKISPNNCLFKMKMAEVLIKENNRTLLLEEIEKIKQLDPNSLLVIDLNIKDFFDNQKYEDGAHALEKRISQYGEDETTADYNLLLLVQEKKYEELVKEIERLYDKYPNNEKIIGMMYSVKKEVYKDNNAALKVYENFFKNNYSYSAYQKYLDILTEQGNNEKVVKIKQRLHEMFPYSPSESYNLSKYYYGAKQYDKAEEYIQKSLALSPYNEAFWEQLGDIKNEQRRSNEALNAYNQSLKYDPNQYLIINKIRKLNGKPDAFKLLPVADIDAIIKADKISDAKNSDYGYYYILDQKDVIMYPGGATEEYYTTIMRITNDKGVDKYKESSIGYNNSQTLLIERAEVVKKNFAKIDGERNENQIVFTNLEAGDIIVFKYRLRSYVYGRFAKEYWDHYYFGGQIYTVATKYHLLMPADQKIYYQFNNSTLQPVIKDVEDFKEYSWEVVKGEPDKDEPLMPPLADVSAVLHVSTIKDWSEIANWYSDISNNKAEEDFEIISLFKKLFPEEKRTMTQFQKARIIYDYIESNIRYSSVSFRQSDYVPQRPSVTLTTRLGDCKDLCSLFVTLAQMAGIKAQMVLANDRDNGQKLIILPSVEFNHCIVKAELDNKKYYVELTDNYLPFASLPNNLNGAQILEIPNKMFNSISDLQLLRSESRTKDIIKRFVSMKPVDDDMEISVKTIKYGNASSSTRFNYHGLDNDKQLKEMTKTVAGSYKNNVKLSSIKFIELDKLNDSIEYSYSYRVKNEISEIGSLKTFRIVYPDLVASLDNFSSETRTYPIEYWYYEDIDNYETVVNISAPTGSKFTEVPASENIAFKEMKYSIQYNLKTPNQLTVTRKFSTNRQNIQPGDYVAFKAFFEKIVKAEQRFIAYK